MSDFITVAYADPPYIGQARKHYGSDEVDHEALIDRLVRGFPDGWALSCSEPSLWQISDILGDMGIRDQVRLNAWVKPFSAFKKNVNPSYSWEPVIWSGGRRRTSEQPTVRNWIAQSITLQKGTPGAKAERWCWWLFQTLGMRPGDVFVDLYTGSGGVQAAWESYVARWDELKDIAVDREPDRVKALGLPDDPPDP